jgi:uncharacterized damage-inducible protein DinB
MSPAIKLVIDNINGNTEFAKMTLADFTDVEMFARPSPKSWHVMFQLGHVVCGEAFLMGKLGLGVPPLPEDFAGMFAESRAAVDDPAQFPSKAKLIEVLDWQRSQTTAALAKLSDADLDKPSPLPNWAPTMGRLLLLIGDHMTMHLGQIQVARRQLNKPILF